MPKVSVIIPTYNRVADGFLENAVKSTLNQTFGDFEVIIIDDGSTDGTKCVIDKLKKQDQRIVYEYQRNMGVAAARNKGLSIARGKYIAFLDSDDQSLPNRLKEQAQILDTKKNVDLVYGTILVNDKRTAKFLEKFGSISTGSIPCYNMYRNLLKYHHSFSICTVMMRRHISSRYKFDERLITGEDYLLLLQASRDYIFYGVDTPFSIIARHGHVSQVQDRINNRFDEKITYDILLREKHEKFGFSILQYLWCVSNHYLYYAKDYPNIKKCTYLFFLLKAFLYFPFNVYIYKHLIGDVLLCGKFTNQHPIMNLVEK